MKEVAEAMAGADKRNRVISRPMKAQLKNVLFICVTFVTMNRDS